MFQVHTRRRISPVFSLIERSLWTWFSCPPCFLQNNHQLISRRFLVCHCLLLWQSFMQSLNKMCSDIGREVSKGVASAERELSTAYNSVRSSPLLVSRIPCGVVRIVFKLALMQFLEQESPTWHPCLSFLETNHLRIVGLAFCVQDTLHFQLSSLLRKLLIGLSFLICCECPLVKNTVTCWQSSQLTVALLQVVFFVGVVCSVVHVQDATFVSLLFIKLKRGHSQHLCVQFKSLKKMGDQLGKEINKGVSTASQEINKAVYGSVVVVSKPILTKNFQCWNCSRFSSVLNSFTLYPLDFSASPGHSLVTVDPRSVNIFQLDIWTYFFQWDVSFLEQSIWRCTVCRWNPVPRTPCPHTKPDSSCCFVSSGRLCVLYENERRYHLKRSWTEN